MRKNWNNIPGWEMVSGIWRQCESICLSIIKLEISRATWAVQGTYQRHDEYGHWKDHVGLGSSDAELGAAGCTASWFLGIIITF